MIDWTLILVVFVAGVILGAFGMAILAMAGNSDLEADNMMLREKLRKYEGKKSK